MITELRRYRIRPEMLDSWIEFFAEAARRNEDGGAHVEFCGVDRETRKSAFYGGEWWNEREAFAMDHVVEYDVTFLETTMHRDGGALVSVPWPVVGERPGSRADSPPDGWTASTRRTFVRE